VAARPSTTPIHADALGASMRPRRSKPSPPSRIGVSRNKSAAHHSKHAAPSVDVKALHATIGAQALEIDFLDGALGQRGPSARR